MTVIVGAASSRSNSRTKAPGRSLTKLKQGSSGGQGPSSTLGGHPLDSADPKANRDIKHRFEITRKLGSGTYGKVSLAYDHKTEREVAVKLIKKSAIENKQDLIRIRREIRIMSMLKHPNIIQIYEVFENKDKIILVMEYASGGELYDYVSKFGSLPEAEARRIFRQITSAVLYCHKHKVAHRDLKLENILLDINNNAKIADFGLSNYFNDKTLLHTFCGSPLYASPEIINGTPYHGPEVDCWSLGILLYTLVYGSMPFDGHDFNRMVRQIKRGAYYEPDTPSTASMLIRNMLRVNPERRADIDDIATHWWLNLDENALAIQELPENQVIDETPLTERAETMVVQDLADETDVFMEFGHLSSATRQKIEEFRRRRQHAEEYNENSPIKPPKARKTDEKELTTKEKSLRQQPADPKDAAKPSTTAATEKDAFHDPLERLRQLESRLQTRQSPDQPSTSKERRNSKPSAIPPKASNLSPIKKEPDVSITSTAEDKRPHFVSPTEAAERKSQSKRSLDNGSNWKMESDTLNILMNQVLEQIDNGPVNINLIARIKAHPMYDQRPMVKELLESIIKNQPAAVRKETSKVIDHAQGLARKQLSGQAVGKGPEKPITSPIKTQAPATIPEAQPVPTGNKYQVAELPTKVDVKAAVAQKRISLEERKWHSVEVGFETDEESSSNGSAGHEQEESELEDEESVGEEIDELADFVEQVAQSNSQVPKQTAPKIVESLSEAQNQPQSQEISADHLSTLERGLAKRISKGKYQHNHIELYGRGLSTEASSPPTEKPKIGGPQPTIEQLPVLFDKAKKFLMKFPDKPEDSDDEAVQKKQEKPKQPSKWTKNQDPDISEKSATATPIPNRRTSDAKETEKDQQKVAAAEKDKPKVPTKAKPETEESEESEDEGEPLRKPRTSAIIGFRTIQTSSVDGSRREAPIAEIRPQAKPYAGINAVSTPPPKTGEKDLIALSRPPKVAMKMYNSQSSARTSSSLTTTDSAEESQEKSTSSEDRRSPGMLSYENAALYIRRKNRERRARNHTIAFTEETWHRIDEKTTEIATIQAATKSKIIADKQDDKADSRKPKTSSTIAAKVERRHSQLERKNSRTEPTTPLERRNSRTGVDSTAIGLERRNSRTGAETKTETGSSYRSERRQSRDILSGYRTGGALADRRKSFHEYSPVEHDDFATVYGAPMNRGPPNSSHFGYGAGRHATGTSRFDAQNSIDDEGVAPSSTYEPPQSSRRFEVYQTRAERAAHDAATAATSGYNSSYRPTSQHYSDRPASSYIGGKSRFDDYSSVDMDPYYGGPSDFMAGTSGASYGFSPSDPVYSANSSRFRPVSRRLGAGIRDIDGRRARARSHSNDQQKYSGTSIDLDAAAALANRMMTPESGPGIDYSYINYHDSSNVRSSQTREPDISLAPSRGILKNKNAFEIEPRASQPRDLGGPLGGYGLRRHMSAEKDLYVSSYAPTPGGFRFGSIGPSVGNSIHPTTHSVYSSNFNNYVEVPKTSDVYASDKKRGSTDARAFLNMARRRTAEIRLGNDGKLTTTTNGYMDDYKRPKSPIDRIKSLFSGSSSKPTGTTSSAYGTNGVSSRYTSAGTTSTAGTKRYTGATTNTRYVPSSRW
ncbi:Protein kinase domain-containing protein [Aphelenchoides bicaudatus]|nr:Protein kinase domain-containing protein [Aphelenchoides bicaudatus]